MKKYILAIDQGTTSSCCILFDHDGNICFTERKEIKLLFPKPGWVEADALEIYLSVLDCINALAVKANITAHNIDSIGITNQRESAIVWDKTTGMPVYNCIIWQSRQSADICEQHEKDKEFIHSKTGLLINPYFSASKIRFILDHIPNGQARAEAGELMFGTIDSWLLYRLTGGAKHYTDITNASRTLLFNIFEKKWDEELCELFKIPMNMLPEVKGNSYYFGDAKILNATIPICGMAGDQQSALFGQTCFQKGECKNTYGTGCFMLENIGNEPLLSNKGLLTTVAWELDGKTTYALEGSVFIGGAVIQWLRDELELIKGASESETLARNAENFKEVYFVPAFVGLGTPYWDDNVRGAIFGLSRGTDKAQIVKAALEAIAYQCRDVFEAMKEETNTDILSLRVDGGATANKYLMQFQSDICGCEIKLPSCLETTALGAAYLSGLCSGFFADLKEIEEIHSYQATFNPKFSTTEADERYKGWKKAIKAAQAFK